MTSPAPAPVDLGGHYRASRERITELLRDASPAMLNTAVPTCPGWSVRDVVAHLVGVIEDAAAGRLTVPPPEELTAEEVERHRGDAFDALLTQWTQMGPFFEPVLTERQIWPAVLDVLSHEHDIRTAIGRPGARDAEAVALCALQLAQDLPFRVELVDVPTQDGSGSPADLRTTAFELLRLRLGRRSLHQTLALAWTTDPAPWLRDLFTFGPSPGPIEE